MSRTVAAVVATMLVVVGWMSASESPASRTPRAGGCRFATTRETPTHVHVLRRTRRSTAFSGLRFRAREMFACASGHRARILGPAVDCPLDCLGVRSIALTERFVAFEAFDNGTRDASDYDRVVVVDLQSGSSRVADAGGHTRFAGDPPYKPPAPGSVTDLVLNVNGHVAWISQDDSGQSRTYLVRTRSAGKAVTLASGPGIQPGSLAAAGARVYWTQDGVARSALSASR